MCHNFLILAPSLGVRLRACTKGIFLGALLLVGCRGAQPAGPAVAVAVSVGSSLNYRPETLTVPANQNLLLEFTNHDGIDHDFTVESFPLTDTRATAAAPLVQFHLRPRNEGQFPFVMQTPGSYRFYCSLPGHRAAGMEGTLIVE